MLQHKEPDRSTRRTHGRSPIASDAGHRLISTRSIGCESEVRSVDAQGPNLQDLRLLEEGRRLHVATEQATASRGSRGVARTNPEVPHGSDSVWPSPSNARRGPEPKGILIPAEHAMAMIPGSVGSSEAQEYQQAPALQRSFRMDAPRSKEATDGTTSMSARAVAAAAVASPSQGSHGYQLSVAGSSCTQHSAADLTRENGD